MAVDKVNILLVDDQPAKLITHQAVLQELNENLICVSSAREAFEVLLKNEIAVILIDVCMPETDGFELATMIQGHPRFEKTAVIFISAVLFNEVDRLRGYEIGAVDYVTVPVIPEVLRAKVKVFVELYRKTQQLEQLNRNLEARVAERTAELATSAAQLRQAERLHGLALAAGQMGSWEWDVRQGSVRLDQGQCDILGVDRDTFVATRKSIEKLLHPDDVKQLESLISTPASQKTFQAEFRVLRPDGQIRWCSGAAAASFDENQHLQRLSGVTVDNLTPEVARQLGFEGSGVVVTQVAPNSAAAEAGLQRGDVIQEVNRREVTDLAGFREAVKAAGDESVLLLVTSKGGSHFVVIER